MGLFNSSTILFTEKKTLLSWVLKFCFFAEINYQNNRWPNVQKSPEFKFRTTFALLYKMKHLIYQDVVGTILIQVVAIYNSFLNS